MSTLELSPSRIDTPVANWRWFIVDTASMKPLVELTTAHQRQLQLQLNSGGKATFWLHSLDPATAYIEVHKTALRCDRNGRTVWSGPIFQATDNADNQGNCQCQVTAMGWLHILNQRLVHTGAEFQNMLAASGAPYKQLGVDAFTQIAYSAFEFPQTSDAAIIFDLLARANIDSPTLIVPGNTYGFPPQRNLTIQMLANMGQQITTLVNDEDGSDIYVDPLTRELNIFGEFSSPSPTIQNGMGFDRGLGTVFTFPGNSTAANRSHDGLQTANRAYAQGQYGIGRADDQVAQGEEGLFETTTSLSNVVDENILIAFANAEVAVKAHPWTIITFTPRAVARIDDAAQGVPAPFDDYFIGDLVYGRVNYGPRFQIGIDQPQALRVYGFTLSIDEGGTEKVTSVQTTYQGVAGATG